MATITVNDTAGLMAALGAAAAGDTILLTAGRYDPMVIRDLKFDGVVTVASAPGGAPAVLTGLELRDSRGLTFQGLEFEVSETGGANQFEVRDSADIRFERIDMHGSLDGNPQNDESGLEIRTSSNVTIANSEFRELFYALGHRDVTGLTVTQNWFHDLRMDGVRGSGTSNLLIEGNRFNDFYRVPNQDHADAIQIWKSPTVPLVSGIVIRDNLILRGDGAVLQGVFIRNSDPEPAFEAVTISGNLVLGGNHNGIAVMGATNVTIDGNVVMGLDGHKSWIRLNDVDGANVQGNSVTDLLVNATVKNLTTALNVTLPPTADRGAALVQDWLADFMASATVQGGASADVLRAGSVASHMRGNDGDDLLIGGAGFDDLNGNVGNDTVIGGADGDWLSGGKDHDLIDGQAGHDIIYGNLGADTCEGGAGNDVIRGGQEDDIVRGGAGDDWLSGDRGADTITGGAGADTFHSFGDAGRDVITDFNPAEGDRVLLDAGTFYSVVQSGGDTVIMMSSGQVVLSGVSLASLTGNWITVG